MKTELYSFNVFQDTETVSEHDVSMVDALEGSIPSLDGTFIIEQQDHCQSCNVSVEFEEEEVIVEKYVHNFVTNEFEFWCLMPLSAIFQLYHGHQF
jgi:hypothetical protein